jgi:AraC family transcriptional regulator, regulatory protein of adaptative response / methylated-DNA-[protein]-cysteine methyltransferase
MKAIVSDANRQRIEQLRGYIRAHCGDGEPLTLEKLSQQADLSPFHLQRTFKAVTGSTPREYLEMCRMEVLKSELRNGKPVTDAIYQAGFGGSSRVYEKVDTRLGMTPREGHCDLVCFGEQSFGASDDWRNRPWALFRAVR